VLRGYATEGNACSGAGELQSLQSTLFTYGQQQQQQQRVNFVVITYL